MKVAILTAGTAIYRGLEEDLSGSLIQKMMDESGNEVVFTKALPNDTAVISTVMQRLADSGSVDLILTNGGAGLGPEDCTPEATDAVIEKYVMGIPEAMRAYLMTKTKRAMLNRCVAGIRGKVLIVNLPGKPGAVKASLSYILPEITHAVSVIKGE